MLLYFVDDLATIIEESTDTPVDIGTLYDQSKLAIIIRTTDAANNDLGNSEDVNPMIQIISQDSNQQLSVSRLEKIYEKLKRINVDGLNGTGYRVISLNAQNILTYVEKTSNGEWIYSSQYRASLQRI